VVELRCSGPAPWEANPEGRKVKGVIHWVSADHMGAGRGAPLRPAVPGAGARGRGDDFLADINPDSLVVLPTAPWWSRPWPASSRGDRFQFEREGYFVADPDSTPERPVFNLTVGQGPVRHGHLGQSEVHPGGDLASEFSTLRGQVARSILGQANLIERLLIALLADGHLLVEGAPGLAKTTAVKQLAAGLEGDFHRIQFTPDLLPADLTGTEIYRPNDGSFRFDRGPIFHNLLLADEVNRAPAKVQSALLEAMGERQVTVGRETYPLPRLFLVMATQNPIEQEGTYPLPEAQLDRFLMHVRVGYPDLATERAILRLNRKEALAEGSSVPRVRLSQASVFAARRAIFDVYMAPEVEDYLVHLVMATRRPGDYSADLEGWLRFGASPRATLALDRCARARPGSPAGLCVARRHPGRGPGRAAPPGAPLLRGRGRGPAPRRLHRRPAGAGAGALMPPLRIFGPRMNANEREFSRPTAATLRAVPSRSIAQLREHPLLCSRPMVRSPASAPVKPLPERVDASGTGRPRLIEDIRVYSRSFAVSLLARQILSRCGQA
jgi:MoxR-like ATPase